jgi:hypothetical protein
MPRVTPRVPHQTPMYEADGRMSRTWVMFFEKLAHFDPGDINRKATFVLKRALTVEDDLTNHYIVRVAGGFYDAALNAKVPPTGAAARFTIERSTDEGVTWESVLNPDPGYLEIPDGDDSVVVYEREIFQPDRAIARVEAGDLLRINCTQIGSTDPGQDITVVVRWE